MMVRRDYPQGGVFSPLLWNMVINSLLVHLNNENLWVQRFADDIAIVINEKFVSTVCELIQKALFIVKTWCRGVGLSFIVDKTSMVLFNNNRMLVAYTIWNGIAEKSVKYLRVILDEKFYWNIHIDPRMQKTFWQCQRQI
jgi:hypothetical protein